MDFEFETWIWHVSSPRENERRQMNARIMTKDVILIKRLENSVVWFPEIKPFYAMLRSPSGDNFFPFHFHLTWPKEEKLLLCRAQWYSAPLPRRGTSAHASNRMTFQEIVMSSAVFILEAHNGIRANRIQMTNFVQMLLENVINC